MVYNTSLHQSNVDFALMTTQMWKYICELLVLVDIHNVASTKRFNYDFGKIFQLYKCTFWQFVSVLLIELENICKILGMFCFSHWEFHIKTRFILFQHQLTFNRLGQVCNVETSVYAKLCSWVTYFPNLFIIQQVIQAGWSLMYCEQCVLLQKRKVIYYLLKFH